MRRLIPLVCLLFLGAAPVAAADGATSPLDTWTADPTTIFESAEVDLDDFKWIARPVIVFADAPEMPAFKSQIELFEARIDELVARDVVLIVDTAPADRSDIRQKLRPRGFMLVLMGKDGGVKLRKPFPWDVRELTRQIDKMPIRQQEIRDALTAE